MEQVQVLQVGQLGQRLQRLQVLDPVATEVERLEGGAARERVQAARDAVIAHLQLAGVTRGQRGGSLVITGHTEPAGHIRSQVTQSQVTDQRVTQMSGGEKHKTVAPRGTSQIG